MIVLSTIMTDRSAYMAHRYLDQLNLGCEKIKTGCRRFEEECRELEEEELRLSVQKFDFC